MHDLKQEARDRAKKWYRENKDKKRAYDFSHKQEQATYKKEYFNKNKKRIYENRKNRIKKYPWVRTFYNIASRCGGHESYIKKGIKCRIRINELKQLWIRDKGHLLKFPSIDRIDRKGNYTFENCQFIELAENLRRKIVPKGKDHYKIKRKLENQTHFYKEV